MIRIDIYAQHVKDAADLWRNGLHGFLFDNHKSCLKQNFGDKKNPIIKTANTYWEKMDHVIEYEYSSGKLKNEYRQYRLCKDVLAYYELHFNDYVLAKEDFLKRNKKVIEYMAVKNPLAKSVLGDVFVTAYNDFCQKQTAYAVMKKLQVNVCPYCNRQYTFTVDGNKKTRPEFDHFYDKASYPLLALSFFNLVSSCHTCNHVKRNDEAAVNPYFHGFEHGFRVVAKDKSFHGDVMTLKAAALKIDLDKRSLDEKKNMETFGLDDLYNQHIDYVESIMDRVKSYNSSVEQALVDSFQGAGNNPQDVADFVWQPYKEIIRNNWPLSKLTKDLLRQFGIIKNE